MKLKDTIKLFNYTYQSKMLLVVIIIFFFNCMMYIFMPVGVVLQGLMASISSTYFVNVTYQAMASGMVQSSEKARKNVLKHFTIILLISNIAHFFIFILTKYFFIMFIEEAPGNDLAMFLLNYMIFNILTYIAVALLYKKQVFGMIILGLMVLLMLVQFPGVIAKSAKFFEETFLGIPTKFEFFGGSLHLGLLFAAFAVCLVSPFIYYIVSKMMINVPISKSYMDRQPWGKL